MNYKFMRKKIMNFEMKEKRVKLPSPNLTEINEQVIET